MLKNYFIKLHGKHLQQKKLRFINWWYKMHPTKYCWADCVAWSFNPTKFNPFKIGNGSTCKIESLANDTDSCYCGCWYKGKCWDTLNELEKRDVLKNDGTNDGLPF